MAEYVLNVLYVINKVETPTTIEFKGTPTEAMIRLDRVIKNPNAVHANLMRNGEPTDVWNREK